MELENQGLQAQLADVSTQLQNASAAHEEAAARAAQLQASLQEAQAGAAAVSAELSACNSKVDRRPGMHSPDTRCHGFPTAEDRVPVVMYAMPGHSSL